MATFKLRFRDEIWVFPHTNHTVSLQLLNPNCTGLISGPGGETLPVQDDLILLPTTHDEEHVYDLLTSTMGAICK